jgi:uncharacterized coiled-coil DUF342 family protein
MSRSRFSIVLGSLALLTLWGCSQNGQFSTVAAKAARLQEEVNNLTKQRDQLRQDLRLVQAAKDRLAEEVQQLRPVVSERDRLRQELETLIAERDATVAQLEAIRKGIKTLMEQVEAALPASGPALGTKAQPSAPRS